MPHLAGFIVHNAYEREQWTPFWMTTATIMGCSGMIFLVFGETDRQDFSVDALDEDVEGGGCPLGVITRARADNGDQLAKNQRHREVRT